MQRLLAQCVSKGIQPHGSSQVPGPSEFQQGSTMLHQGSRKVPLATRFVFEAGSSGFQARFQRGSSKGSSKGSSNTSDIPAKFQQGPSKVQQSSSNGPGRFQQGPARFQQGSSKAGKVPARFREVPARFQQGPARKEQGSARFQQCSGFPEHAFCWNHAPPQRRNPTELLLGIFV